MSRVAIISVDGHVKAPRAAYVDYLDQQYRDDYQRWVKSVEGTTDGFFHPFVGESAQWDSNRRLADLESQGVVAEVCFANGGVAGTAEDIKVDDRHHDLELEKAVARAHNRWLVDFCADAPGRRAGQALVSFDDIDEAVEEVSWAKEHGLQGVMMPGLYHPDGVFYFDPVLDPFWAACQDADMTITQHGDAGLPEYVPLGLPSYLSLVLEHEFFSGRSLWQMIAGGVFDRFPQLRLSFVEAGAEWIPATLAKLDGTIGRWSSAARENGHEVALPFARTPREYWESNCYLGVSPFDSRIITMDELVGRDAQQQPLPGLHIGSDNAMFGVDFPHSESLFPNTMQSVAMLVGHPSITEADAHKILYANAAEAYGFDLDALQPDIERIGFELDEVVADAPA